MGEAFCGYGRNAAQKTQRNRRMMEKSFDNAVGVAVGKKAVRVAELRVGIAVSRVGTEMRWTVMVEGCYQTHQRV
jgi:hypothetical protein